MQRSVEEREQPEHATELDDLIPAGNASERRDRERDRDEGDRPGPGLIGEVVAWVGGEGVEVAQDNRAIQTVRQRRGGDERRGEAEGLDDGDRL